MGIAIVIMSGIVLSAAIICVSVLVSDRNTHRHEETMKQLELDHRILERTAR